MSINAFPPASGGGVDVINQAVSMPTLAPMPTARGYAGCAVDGGVLYVIGGYDGTNDLTVNEAYDTATDTWTTKASLPSARRGSAVANINGLIYVTSATSFDAYDPATDTWTAKASMPTGRYYTAGAVVNGIFYVIGGYDGTNDLTVNEAYDPVADAWTTKTSMPTARRGLVVVEFNGLVYVTAGYQGTTGITATEIYDPATDAWTTKAPITTGRNTPGYGIVNNRLYVIGGYTGSATNANEIYDFASDSWSTGAPLPTARWALLTQDAQIGGKVYCVGGNPGGGHTGINEAYSSEFPFKTLNKTVKLYLQKASLRNPWVIDKNGNRFDPTVGSFVYADSPTFYTELWSGESNEVSIGIEL